MFLYHSMMIKISKITPKPAKVEHFFLNSPTAKEEEGCLIFLLQSSFFLYLKCSRNDLKTGTKKCFSPSPRSLLDRTCTPSLFQLFSLQLSGCSSMLSLLLLLSYPFFPTSLRGDKLKCRIDFYHFSHCCIHWLAGFGCVALILFQCLSFSEPKLHCTS